MCIGQIRFGSTGICRQSKMWEKTLQKNSLKMSTSFFCCAQMLSVANRLKKARDRRSRKIHSWRGLPKHLRKKAHKNYSPTKFQGTILQYEKGHQFEKDDSIEKQCILVAPPISYDPWMSTSVTRWVCEKIVQNFAQPIFVKINAAILPWKKAAQKYWLLFNFQKLP
jgi:hypothetical protein